jgi:hypothetical protein
VENIIIDEVNKENGYTSEPIVRAPDDDDEYGPVGGIRTGRGNRSTRRKPSSVPIFPQNISHDWTWNPHRRGKKPATNHLSYGTIYVYE